MNEDFLFAIENYLHWRQHPDEFVGEPLLMLVKDYKAYLEETNNTFRLERLERDYPQEKLNELEYQLK